MPRKRTAAALLLAPIAIVAGVATWAERNGQLYVWFPQLAPPPLTITEADGTTWSGRLLKVRDGDTVEVRYHDLVLPLRLRNLDTEESVHPDPERNTALGRETSAWAKDLLGSARVRVEFHRDGWEIDTDHHGRALAMLWLDNGEAGPSDDDELYNEIVIRRGYSPYVTKYGNAGPYHQRLLEAEQAARAEGLGVWAK